METEEIISAFSSMSLESNEAINDQPLSWKGGLSAEKGLLRTVSLKNRPRPSMKGVGTSDRGTSDRRKSLENLELKTVAGIVKRNSIKRKGSKKKKTTANTTDTSEMSSFEN